MDSAWAGTHLSVPEYRDELMLNEINKYVTSINISMHKVSISLFVEKSVNIKSFLQMGLINMCKVHHLTNK